MGTRDCREGRVRREAASSKTVAAGAPTWALEEDEEEVVDAERCRVRDRGGAVSCSPVEAKEHGIQSGIGEGEKERESEAESWRSRAIYRVENTWRPPPTRWSHPIDLIGLRSIRNLTWRRVNAVGQ